MLFGRSVNVENLEEGYDVNHGVDGIIFCFLLRLYIVVISQGSLYLYGNCGLTDVTCLVLSLKFAQCFSA